MSDMLITIPRGRLKYIAGFFLTLALALASFGLYLAVYRFKNESAPVRVIAALLRLPVARVDGVFVPYGDYERNVEAQAAYYSSEAAKAIGVNREINDADRALALERAVRMKAVDLMAERAGIKVTDLDVERAYDRLAGEASTSSNPGEFETILKNMTSLTPEEFKRLVVKPGLQEDTLKERRRIETDNSATFENELEALLTNPETKRYLTWSTAAQGETLR